jgi:cellulose synthase/poly-beta-1,6-N-acetylglucosamine synthase-like glycosyltransferase
VAGAVYVGNANRLLTRFQALEYVISQNLDRRALELVNGITVVPGAIGAWRRDAVVAVEGYDTDTLAEDADLTVKLERAGWKVVHEPRAFAITEAPETVAQFVKQRFRWMFGTLQVAFKNLRNLSQLPLGLKYVTLPNVLVFQFLFALIAPVIDLALVLSIAADLRDYYTRFSLELSDRTWSILTYWLVLQTVEVVVGVIGMHLDRRRAPWGLLPLIILQRFCYRQLTYWVAMKATAAAIRGGMIGWGKLQRRGLRHLDADGVKYQLPLQLKLPAPTQGLAEQ